MPFTFLGATFTEIFKWVIHNGYPLIFAGMIVEGPTIIAAASFAAAMGYFNLGIVFIFGILGDLIGDFIWYTLGYFSRVAFVKKYGYFFGASDQRMEKLKNFLEKHPGKTLAAIKLSPFLPIPGLIVVGTSHMSPKKFALVIGSIILPKTLLFMSVGYFFGRIYDKISIYINNGVYAIGIFLIAGFFIRYIYKKIAANISKKIENS